MKCNSSEGKDNIADSSTGPSLCLSIENPSRNFKQKVFFLGGGVVMGAGPISQPPLCGTLHKAHTGS